MTGTELYDLFWENSTLSEATIEAFVATANEKYAGSARPTHRLQYPGSDQPLRRPGDRQFKQMLRRASSRRFSSRPLDARQVGGILAAFAAHGKDGRRVYGSAGATYPVEIFCLLNNCAGPASGKVAYYNADNHSLAAVRELPSWDAYADAIHLDTQGTVPQLVVVFVLMPERVTEKYGERGGRFGLIEVGAAAQNLALRLVEEGLVGCAAGGLVDDQIRRLLGLEATTAQIALGYACGIRAPGPRRG